MTLPDLDIDDRAKKAMAPPVSTEWFFVAWYLGIALWVGRLRYKLMFWVLSRRRGVWITRKFVAILRAIHPVPRLGKIAIPLRAADLRDMLRRVDDFNAAEAMCPRLPAGQVVLAIDWPRRHGEERARLEEVLDHARLTDDARIREIVRDRCHKDFGAYPCLNGRNLARLCEDVAFDVAEGHLGIGVGTGPERDKLRPIIRWLAARVFQGPVKGSPEETFALIASDRMQSLAQHCFEQADAELRQAAADGRPIPPEKMTVLQRMIALRNNGDPALGAALGLKPRVHPNLPHAKWLDDDWIIRNIVTLTVFGSVTSARAMTQAIPRLLEDDERWRAGLAASQGYARCNPDGYDHTVASSDERDTIEKYRLRLREVVFEAMRWHPMLSMLGFRTTLRDTVLSSETPEKTRVAAGAQVLPLLLGAMHDPEGFPDPGRFCPHERSVGDHLHFGAGPHECVGRHMAEIQLEEITHALFQHRCVALKRPKCQPIEYEGPCVTKLEFKTCSSPAS
ncbi:MAG: cytochrome P450 [Pseudomonadota bacterium]